MGPKSKKAKGLTPEEIAAKEEEARKQREHEEKLAAEELKRKEIEEAKLRAQLKAIRVEEVARLTEECEKRDNLVEKCRLQMQAALKLRNAEIEWSKFREAVDETDASNEKELNTFLALCKEVPVQDMNDALSLIKKLEVVTLSVRNHWSECLANQDAKGQSIAISYMSTFSTLMIELLDKGTSHYLNANTDKNDLFVEEIVGNVMIGLWGSRYTLPRKKVEMEKLGVQLDIPKQLLSFLYIHRVVRIPYEVFNMYPYDTSTSSSVSSSQSKMMNSSKIVVGDLYLIELVHPAKSSHDIISRKWVIRDNSRNSKSVKKSDYPCSATCKVSIRIPDTVVMSNDLRMAVWSEQMGEFTEDGITEFQYSEPTRTIAFYIVCTGTFALVKDRTADLPYKKCHLSPYRDLSGSNYDKLCKFTVTVGQVELVINISGDVCFLSKSNVRPLTDLLNVSMSPGLLLFNLQRRGVNLMPTSLDLARVNMAVKKV